MGGFSFLMLIFSILILLAGIYLYTGHKSELLLWKTYNVKNMPMKEVKNIGKWTMISSLIPLLLAILGVIFNI